MSDEPFEDHRPETRGIYEPLPTPHTLRLLQLKPGLPQSSLECKLLYIELDDNSPFEALSYVWGDPSVRTTIRVNGNVVSVGKSLGDALQRLRLLNRSRLIWADAICINQNDMDERSAQVSIMGKIYEKAARVMVWLGPDNKQSSECALTLMAAIVQTIECNCRSRGLRWVDLPGELKVVHAALDRLGAFGDFSDGQIWPFWEALADFFSREWFSRIWCVQEIVVSQDSVLMCGDVDIPWYVVGITADWIEAQMIEHDFRAPPLLQGIPIENAVTMWNYSDPDLQFDNILDALLRHRGFGATDPRDKIYGILGLLKDEDIMNLIQVTYRKSVVELYIELAVAALKSYKDLSILSYVQHPSSFDQLSPFPSWVPRWDCSLTESMRIGYEDDLHYPSGDRRLEDFSYIAPSSLRLRGVRLGGVELVSDIMDYKQFGLASEVLSETTARPPVAWHLWHQTVNLQQPRDVEKTAARLIFARTLTCEMNAGYDNVDALDVDDRLKFNFDFFAYINHLNQLFGIVDYGEATDDLSSSISTTDGTVRPYTPNDKFESEEGDWQRFDRAASRMCDDRRFFLTTIDATQFMGLGPSAMRENDDVVVLFGARTPLILRQTNSIGSTPQAEKNRSSYHFIGEAWVSEMMDGEATSMLEAGILEEMEFEIK